MQVLVTRLDVDVNMILVNYLSLDFWVFYIDT